MSWSKTVPRARHRIKTSSGAAVTMADVDALGSVALDLEAVSLFLELRHYVDEERRQNHVEILLEAATAALRQARSTFDAARNTLGRGITHGVSK